MSSINVINVRIMSQTCVFLPLNLETYIYLIDCFLGIYTPTLSLSLHVQYAFTLL